MLVLDEPTSGLDPGYEKAVMTTLRQLADAGRTVIAVTHSIAGARSTATACCTSPRAAGSPTSARPPAPPSYFGSADAADVFLALDTEPGQAWKERFRAHPAYARYVHPGRRRGRRASADAPPAGRGAATRPGWRSQVAHPAAPPGRAPALRPPPPRPARCCRARCSACSCWLVLAADSLAPRPRHDAAARPASETVAMFVALSATWLGASNTVREIVKERHIVRREVDAGLAPSAYVAAKGLVLGVAHDGCRPPCSPSIACAGQHPPATVALSAPGGVELAAVGALVGLAATALGLLLSALVTSPDKALAVLPMTLVTELVLAGRWAATLDAPGPRPCSATVTGARWGVEAIGATGGRRRPAPGCTRAVRAARSSRRARSSARSASSGATPGRRWRRRSAADRLQGLRLRAERRGHRGRGGLARGRRRSVPSPSWATVAGRRRRPRPAPRAGRSRRRAPAEVGGTRPRGPASTTAVPGHRRARDARPGTGRHAHDGAGPHHDARRPCPRPPRVAPPPRPPSTPTPTADARDHRPPGQVTTGQRRALVVVVGPGTGSP